MRSLKKNKQTLYYANFVADIPIYAYDENGNVLTTNVDGVDVPVIESYHSGYGEVTEFEANISFDSGQTVMAEYGLDTSKYNAIINATKGELPFNEQTIIWHTSSPQYKDKQVLPESADYKVIAIKTSLNEERFILKKLVDEGVRPTPSA